MKTGAKKLKRPAKIPEDSAVAVNIDRDRPQLTHDPLSAPIRVAAAKVFRVRRRLLKRLAKT